MGQMDAFGQRVPVEHGLASGDVDHAARLLEQGQASGALARGHGHVGPVAGAAEQAVAAADRAAVGEEDSGHLALRGGLRQTDRVDQAVYVPLAHGTRGFSAVSMRQRGWDMRFSPGTGGLIAGYLRP